MTANDQPQKHILLVEDDAGIAEPLSYALKRQNWQVTWHTHGEAALAEITQRSMENTGFDFIILDVGLPDTNGFDLCKKIRASQQTPLLFLTAQNDEIDRILGLEIGADDYCAKPFSPREIVSRIKAICRRNAYVPDVAIEKTADMHWQAWQFDSKTYVLTFKQQPLDVSKSELQLLLALLAHPTQVFSREQLLAHMSEHPEHRLPRTVDSHIKSIRQKLAKLTSAEVIQTHRGIGYSLVAENAES